jgi:hypothetical protein
VAARSLPWYLVDVAAPAASAALLTVVRIEGRPFHVAGRALVGHAVNARQLVRWRPAPIGQARPSEGCTYWVPPEIVLLPDGSDQVMRRLRYRGPGAVLVSVGHRREAPPEQRRGFIAAHLMRRRRLELRQASAKADDVVIVLARGTELRTG